MFIVNLIIVVYCTMFVLTTMSLFDQKKINRRTSIVAIELILSVTMAAIWPVVIPVKAFIEG